MMEDILDAGGNYAPPITPENKQEDSDYLAEVWLWFSRMYVIRYQSLQLLGGNNIQQFWDNSVVDYSALTADRDDNNPVVPYTSSVSRDKANVFIAMMAARMYFPSVTAQNSEQGTDKIVTRIAKPLLQWASDNDGFPDESGMLKNCRYIHKLVVEGTVHVQDDVTKDGLMSSLVPNEEIFIPNFWTSSIEKQPIVIRAQLNITWGEAEAMFGHLDKWKYVQRNGGWLQQLFVQYPELKNVFEGIIFNDKATILWVQKKATNQQIKELKKKGKLDKDAKRAVFYNILVNNVLLFPVDNLSPYKDGYYSIKKGIFEPMAKTEFYYGNSMPNKISEDKRWIDAWKTMMRFLAKQNALRPMQNLGGGDFDDTVYLPGQVTNVDDGIALAKIDGIGDGINASHVQMLRLAQEEINMGTVSNVTGGQFPESKETATASAIVAGNARQLMDNFTREVVFFHQARAVPLLMRLFQFLPRRDIKKLSIPEQMLKDGTKGSLEIIFKKLPKMSPDEMLQESSNIRNQEQASRKNKSPKDLVFVDPEYIKNITFYVRSDAATATMDEDGQRAQRFERLMPVLLQNPDIFDRKSVGREIIQMNDLSEDIISQSNSQPSQPGMQQQGQQPQGNPAQPQGTPGPATAPGPRTIGQVPQL
jgi:hypothetical protein